MLPANVRCASGKPSLVTTKEGHDNLLAVATVIARVSSLGQLVFGRQSLEVGTREVVEYQAVTSSRNNVPNCFSRSRSEVASLELLSN